MKFSSQTEMTLFLLTVPQQPVSDCLAAAEGEVIKPPALKRPSEDSSRFLSPGTESQWPFVSRTQSADTETNKETLVNGRH